MKAEEKQRYSRHLLISEFGEEGIKRIFESKILIVGCGGLGSPVASYLAAAGVGTIGLIDGDVVELSNLQRQVIHSTSRLGMPKVESAYQYINDLNPDVNVIAYHQLLTTENAAEIISPYNFIIECTDNYDTKFLVNDYCVALKKPFSHGSVLRFEGQTLTYVPGAACYRCVYETPPPEGTVPGAAQVGVLGSVAGLLGTIQATEALKYITRTGELLLNRLLVVDALTMNFLTLNINPSTTCQACNKIK